jgi:hypothetical protein
VPVRAYMNALMARAFPTASRVQRLGIGLPVVMEQERTLRLSGLAELAIAVAGRCGEVVGHGEREVAEHS